MANSFIKGAQLLSARTTNGTDGYKSWEYGSKAILQVYGTFNGATITLDVLAPDNATDIQVNNSSGAELSITDVGTYALDVVPGQQIKATVASAGGSTSLSAFLAYNGE
jgi:hypothetical protein